MALDHIDTKVPELLIRYIERESPQSACLLCQAIHRLAVAQVKPGEELSVLDLNTWLLDTIPDSMNLAYAQLRDEA